jgi:signal transduction histidine kinase/ligand-binding sensor domain-containing protein
LDDGAGCRQIHFLVVRALHAVASDVDRPVSMTRRPHAWTWLIILLGWSVTASAFAECSRDLAQFRLETWQTDDGLPLDAVYSLAQTPDKLIWIGTEAGVARFDGAKMVSVDLSSVMEGAAEHVPTLAVTRDGVLLAGTRVPGLLQIGLNTVERLPLDAVAASLLPMADGTVWIGTRSDGLWVQSGTDVEATPVPGTRSSRISALAARSAGGVWIGYGDGGVQYVKGGNVFDIEPDSDALHVLALLEGDSGTLWVGTREGLFRIQSDELTAVAQVPEAVGALMQDRRGNIWVGLADGGLRRLCDGRPDAIDSLTESQGIASGPIKELMQAEDGSVWVATHGGGVVRLSQGAALPVMADQGLPDRPVLPILRHPSGNMVAGTFGAGVVTIDSESHRVTERVEGLPDDHVFSLAPAREGEFWAGTRRGIALVRDGRVVLSYSDQDGLPASTVISLLIDEERLWIGTAAGLASLEGTTISSYASGTGEVSAAVVQMHVDRLGRVWVGTDGDGLYRVEGDQLVRPAFHEQLASQTISGFHETDQELWIVTMRGLLRWDGRHAQAVLPSAGLPEPQLHSMLDDGHGRFWLSGNRGIFSVDKQDLRAAAARGSKLTTVHRFTRADGMPRSETNGGFQPAAATSGDGRLWYPTSDGIAVLDPSSASPRDEHTSVFLTEVVVGDELVESGDRLPLPTNPLPLRIEYTAPEFSFPERLEFRYRLAGLEPDWYETTERSALFHRLPAGNMTFEVQARLDKGPWSESATLSVVVDRHLLESTWFWVTLALAGAVALILGYTLWHRARVAQLRRLQQTQKLESIGLLASGISHDFRNVLQSVIAGVELVRQELPPGSAAWEDAGHALDAANRGVAIARQLLAFGRAEPGERVSISLHAEVGQMSAFLERLLPVSVRLEMSRLTDVGTCDIDPVQLQQVMLNLVSNAGDAMPGGGVVQVALDRVDDNVARIRVSDTGDGIPAEVLDRIFEPFFTTKAEGSGTGLGLAVAYGIVKDTGGTIEVSSSREGTSFDILLPVNGHDR